MSRLLPYRHGHRPCVSACARGFVSIGAQAQAQARAQLVTEPVGRETRRRRRLALRAEEARGNSQTGNTDRTDRSGTDTDTGSAI